MRDTRYLYLSTQSRLLLPGTASEILVQRSLPKLAGKALSASSSNFCSSGVQAASEAGEVGGVAGEAGASCWGCVVCLGVCGETCFGVCGLG